MKHVRAVLIGWLLLLGMTHAAGAQSVDETARVKALYRSATLHYNLGEYKEAMAQFKEAYQIRPDPVFLFNIGQCSRQLGDPAAALKAYRSFLREVPNAPNRSEVEKLLVSLEAAIAAKTKAPIEVQSPADETPRKPPAETAPTTTTTTTTTPATATTPPSSAAITAPPATPPVDEKPKSKSKVGVAVAVTVVAVVLVGAGLGLGLGLGLQPMPPGSTLGTSIIRF